MVISVDQETEDKFLALTLGKGELPGDLIRRWITQYVTAWERAHATDEAMERKYL